MKKLMRLLKFRYIDVHIYKMDQYIDFSIPEFKYAIERKRLKNKWLYTINDGDTLVHRSYLYDAVFLLKSINKKGPVIGDCFTHKAFRGQSIYPMVINTIAKETLQNTFKELFVVVNRDNISSIKGIEKAGFVIFVSIKAKRWLWFYLEREIHYYK